MTNALADAISITLNNRDKQCLWVADENNSVSDLVQFASDRLTVVTNRYDLFAGLLQHDIASLFSDYNFSDCKTNSMDLMIYPVSKEKPVTHHVINEAWRLLKPGAELILFGEKNSGIKTYAEKAATLLGCRKNTTKQGKLYLSGLTKQTAYNEPQCLDSKNYGQLREVAIVDQNPVMSKPGIYGWQKIDQGSVLLADTVSQWLKETSAPPNSLLDLGCGYGYLTLRSAKWPSVEQRSATDNNAAAVQATQINCNAFGLEVQVSADDCGNDIHDRFDLILCNPPFHRGFNTDRELTDLFLASTHRLLSSRGRAFFVVNQFIALEKKAKPYFKSVQQHAHDGQFKVIKLEL